MSNLNRRDFIKTAAGTALGALGFPYFVPASALGKFGTIAPSNRITIGFIGMGAIGNSNLRGFAQKPEVEIAAICDVDKVCIKRGMSTVEKERGIKCKTYIDFRELVARHDIDAVCISTPDHWHAVMGVIALRAGKDVYGEKPLAYSVAEGRAICEAVEQYSRVWQTGSIQRSMSQFRFACELVRDGYIGKVQTVKIGLPGSINRNADGRGMPVPNWLDWDLWLGPAPYRPYSDQIATGRRWMWVSDFGGGQIQNWAGHHCDIAQWAMGTELTGPVEVEGTGTALKGGVYDTIANFDFTCRYKEGFTMQVSDSPGFEEGILFEGNDGKILVNRAGVKTEPASLRNVTIGPNEIRLYKSSDHRQNFLDCVRTRQTPIANAQVAQRSITIGHLAILSIKLGRKLRWDPQDEKVIGDEQASRMLSRPMRGQWCL